MIIVMPFSNDVSNGSSHREVNSPAWCSKVNRLQNDGFASNVINSNYEKQQSRAGKSKTKRNYFESMSDVVESLEKRNERERSRVGYINSILDDLRTRIPETWQHKKMTKLDILQKATAYIQQLRTVLDADTVKNTVSQSWSRNGSLRNNTLSHNQHDGLQQQSVSFAIVADQYSMNNWSGQNDSFYQNNCFETFHEKYCCVNNNCQLRTSALPEHENEPITNEHHVSSTTQGYIMNQHHVRSSEHERIMNQHHVRSSEHEHITNQHHVTSPEHEHIMNQHHARSSENEHIMNQHHVRSSEHEHIMSQHHVTSPESKHNIIIHQHHVPSTAQGYVMNQGREPLCVDNVMKPNKDLNVNAQNGLSNFDTDNNLAEDWWVDHLDINLDYFN